MKGSVLSSTAEQFSALWRDYWRSHWHVPLTWDRERLSCFLSASDGRADHSGSRRQPLVRDYPGMRNPFLGVVTHGSDSGPASDAGVLEFNDDGHLLTIAPTRTGKGAGQIIPNLLLYAGSCLVIDIKGENYDITSEHRADMFQGATIIKFAPFERNSHTYNPLDFIRVDEDGDANSYTFDDVRLLSEMLVPARPRQEFWDLEARNLVTTLLFYTATSFRRGSPDRTMKQVTNLLFPSAVLVPNDSTAQRRILGFDDSINTMSEAARVSNNRVLISMLNTFLDHDEKVRAGILSTCRATMNIWLSTRLQLATARSTFQFADLKESMCRPLDQNPAPTTIYLIIPPEHLHDYCPVMRMIVGLAAIELTRRGDWVDRPGWRELPPCPVLFLLDEFPALGPMTPISNGVAYLAGYGVQIWTFAQSVGQLKQLYGDNWTTFVSNAGAACYFGISDPELAESLAKQLGTTDEYAHAYETSSYSFQTSGGSSSSSTYTAGSGSSSGDSSSTGYSSSDTTSQNLRFKRDAVATAADIRALPPQLQLIMLRNRRAVLATLLPYYQCELFGNLYGSWGAGRDTDA